MRKKIVLWGTDEKEQKVLIALELKAEENKVNITSFPEAIASELFYNDMMESWRIGKDVTFPEGHTTIEKDLSVTDNLLPEAIKVDRTDIINRASTEWHFVVLSTKLFEMYKSELSEKTEKVSQLTKFDNHIWAEMKEFWGKVQDQVFEKNLLHNHARELKDGTNKLFDELKKLKSVLDKEFNDFSVKNKEAFDTRLGEIEGKIQKGFGLKPIFEQLKEIQKDYRNAKFTREDRSAIWDRLDKAFKEVKNKRFGDDNKGSNTASGRFSRRLDGLSSAIDKMQRSINRDKKDIEFQNSKINSTDGQLEQQIRQAKLKMIEERISSKQIKLDEMNATKADLEKKVAKELEKEKLEEAKAAAKKKIAKKMEGQESSISLEEKAKLAAAAKDLASKKKSKTSKVPLVELPSSETATDAKASIVDKASEVKDAATDKASDAKEALADKAGAAKDVMSEKTADVKAKAADAKEAISEKSADIKDSVVEKTSDAKEALADKAGAAKDAMSEKTADVKAKATDAKEALSEKSADIKDTVAEKANDAKEALADKAGAAKDAMSEKTADVKAKAAETKEALSEKSADIKDTAADKASDAKDSIVDKLSGAKDAIQDKMEGLSGGEKLVGGGIIAGLAGAVIGAKDKITDKIDELTDNIVDDKNEEKSDLNKSVENAAKEVSDVTKTEATEKSTGEKLAGGGLIAGLAGAVIGAKDKITDKIDDLTDTKADLAGDAKDLNVKNVEDAKEAGDEKSEGLSTSQKLAGGGILAGLAGAVSGVIEDAVESAKSMAGTVSEKVDDAVDKVVPDSSEE